MFLNLLLLTGWFFLFQRLYFVIMWRFIILCFLLYFLLLLLMLFEFPFLVLLQPLQDPGSFPLQLNYSPPVELVGNVACESVVPGHFEGVLQPVLPSVHLKDGRQFFRWVLLNIFQLLPLPPKLQQIFPSLFKLFISEADTKRNMLMHLENYY